MWSHILIFVILNFAMALATSPELNVTTTSVPKKSYNNSLHSLDGPLRQLVETGTLQTPCNNSVKTVTENPPLPKIPLSPLPMMPLASHRNYYRTVNDPYYYQPQYQQLQYLQPQQQQHQAPIQQHPQQEEPIQHESAQLDAQQPKYPHFYYYFTKKPYEEATTISTIATPKSTITTTTPTTTITTTATPSTTTTTTHKPVKVQHRPNLYGQKYRFVLGVPMTKLEVDPNDLKAYYDRLQFDPHAYFPKEMQPKYMPMPTPYQPLYHIVRAVIVPDQYGQMQHPLMQLQQTQQQYQLGHSVHKITK